MPEDKQSPANDADVIPLVKARCYDDGLKLEYLVQVGPCSFYAFEVTPLSGAYEFIAQKEEWIYLEDAGLTRVDLHAAVSAIDGGSRERDGKDVVLRDGQFPVDEDGYDNFVYWLGQVRLLTLLALEGSSNASLDAIRDALARGLSPDAFVQSGLREFIVVLAADPQSSAAVWGCPCFRSPRHAQMLVDELRGVVRAVRAVPPADKKQ
jgi:hypothetical protein